MSFKVNLFKGADVLSRLKRRHTSLSYPAVHIHTAGFNAKSIVTNLDFRKHVVVCHIHTIRSPSGEK